MYKIAISRLLLALAVYASPISASKEADVESIECRNPTVIKSEECELRYNAFLQGTWEANILELTSWNPREALKDCWVKELANTLEHNDSLQTLRLIASNVGSAGAEALAKALEKNRTLKILDLEYTQIEDTGAEALEKALNTGRALQKLDLSCNFILNKVKERLKQHRCVVF